MSITISQLTTEQEALISQQTKDCLTAHGFTLNIIDNGGTVVHINNKDQFLFEAGCAENNADSINKVAKKLIDESVKNIEQSTSDMPQIEVYIESQYIPKGCTAATYINSHIEKVAGFHLTMGESFYNRDKGVLTASIVLNKIPNVAHLEYVLSNTSFKDNLLHNAKTLTFMRELANPWLDIHASVSDVEKSLNNHKQYDQWDDYMVKAVLTSLIEVTVPHGRLWRISMGSASK